MIPKRRLLLACATIALLGLAVALSVLVATAQGPPERLDAQTVASRPTRAPERARSRETPTPVSTAKPTPAPSRQPSASSTGRCGGDLPPCWVMMRESGGNIRAHNPTGCSGRGCYGKWQCDPRTCDGTGSEAEQDAEARRVWDHGRGCSHWNAC